MQGVEQVYCDVSIHALIKAWQRLMEVSANEVLQRVAFGKGDTLGLDAIPEIIIAEQLRTFDRHALLITEEEDETMNRRLPSDSDPVRQPLMFFSDPTDRSKQLGEFITAIADGRPSAKIGELMAERDVVREWEEMFEKPASITGATTSITCIRKGSIVFAVVLNYITRTIFVAAPAGVYHMALPAYTERDLATINHKHVVDGGKELQFPPAMQTCTTPGDAQRFVTFLGKSGYQENFDDSKILGENPDPPHHRVPGGPSRVLYLSELQQGYEPIGFVLANGEKIGEWMPWLAFVKFALDVHHDHPLRAFEISLERPWIKDGVLMSTSPPYSIFCIEEGRTFLDISRLRQFHHPSRFRSMLVVAPRDNDRIIYLMQEHQWREVGLSL